MYVDQVGLKLTEIPWLCLSNAGITVIYHHTWPTTVQHHGDFSGAPGNNLIIFIHQFLLYAYIIIYLFFSETGLHNVVLADIELSMILLPLPSFDFTHVLTNKT